MSANAFIFPIQFAENLLRENISCELFYACWKSIWNNVHEIWGAIHEEKMLRFLEILFLGKAICRYFEKNGKQKYEAKENVF